VQFGCSLLLLSIGCVLLRWDDKFKLELDGINSIKFVSTSLFPLLYLAPCWLFIFNNNTMKLLLLPKAKLPDLFIVKKFRPSFPVSLMVLLHYTYTWLSNHQNGFNCNWWHILIYCQPCLHLLCLCMLTVRNNT